MKDIENSALKNPVASLKPKTQPMASKRSDEKPSGANYQLANLSLRTATRLENCMDSLAKDENVESVKAICMCAGELNKIMRLNLEFYKEGI